MTISAAPITITIMALALAASGGAPPAAVPPSGGTIAIRLLDGDGRETSATPAFMDAVTATLETRGFTILDDPDHAAYVADLLLSRGDVGTGLGKASGRNGAAIVGGGVAIPLSTGRSALVPLRRTRLELRIHGRGVATIVWDGAAVTIREAGTRKGGDAAVAADLSQAILRAYPAQPEGVIGVP